MMKTVILKRSALKNPVNRAPSVTLRDPSLALRMTAYFLRQTGGGKPRPYSLTETLTVQRGSPNFTVILKRSALKNPVNRAPSVTLRDPSLALRMTAYFLRQTGGGKPRPYSLTETLTVQRGSPNFTVILKRSALKNPVSRAPSVTLRDPSLTLRMTAYFLRQKRRDCGQSRLFHYSYSCGLLTSS